MLPGKVSGILHSIKSELKSGNFILLPYDEKSVSLIDLELGSLLSMVLRVENLNTFFFYQISPPRHMIVWLPTKTMSTESGTWQLLVPRKLST